MREELHSQFLTSITDERLKQVLIRVEPWRTEGVLAGIPDSRLPGILAALGDDQRRNPCRVRRLIQERLKGRPQPCFNPVVPEEGSNHA